ncbi:MAG: hypothetical protein EA355_05805 [Rhodobacteraceae bacterium]|nr:MAG: hypothetical protein EA355_05805 [Paracoccaceae bacterium]
MLPVPWTPRSGLSAGSEGFTGRRKFGREFKLEAVRLVRGRGVAAARACRDLDLAECVPPRWMRELDGDPVVQPRSALQERGLRPPRFRSLSEPGSDGGVATVSPTPPRSGSTPTTDTPLCRRPGRSSAPDHLTTPPRPVTFKVIGFDSALNAPV